jgi:hypothetical protein
MYRKQQLWLWLGGAFLLALAVIGMSQNTFRLARINVGNHPLVMDFKDQKVRVIGWERDYAAITVDKQTSNIEFIKKHFGIIKPQDGKIVFKKIAKNNFYFMDSWVVLLFFKPYQNRYQVINLVELHPKTVFTVKVPHKAAVVIRGKVLEATGCRVKTL